MAFTLGATAAKDGAGTTIPGGLLSADIAGGGVGPTFLYHSLVDGLAGSNRLNITAANALKTDGSAVTQPVSNAGTFAVQAAATLAAETTKVIGTVNIAAAQTLATVTTVGAVTAISNALPAGTNAIGKLAANSGVDIGDVDVTTIGGQAPAFGSGANGATVLRVGLATDSPGVIATAAPGTLSAAGPSVTAVNPSNYETVAASQTAQALGATGATGDFINGILVTPANLNPGNVLLLDNATSITVFTGGTASVSNLVPFFIPLGMTSVSGAWKITTGASVSCIGVGKFT